MLLGAETLDWRLLRAVYTKKAIKRIKRPFVLSPVLVELQARLKEVIRQRRSSEQVLRRIKREQRMLCRVLRSSAYRAAHVG